MAVDSLSGSDDGGNARVRVMAGALCAGNMGLGNPELLSQGSLRQLPEAAHDRQLSRERECGKQLGVFQRRFRMCLQ